MAFKLDIILITIELWLVVLIVLDIYGGRVSFETLEDDPDGAVLVANLTVDDPEVVKIGNFAVDEYNKYTDSNLRFRKVVKVVFAQSSYMVLVQVLVDGFESKQFAAIVQERGGQRGLVAFEEYSGYGL